MEDLPLYRAATERKTPLDPIWAESDFDDLEHYAAEEELAAARPRRIGIGPIALAAGVVGVAWLGIRLLSKRRPRFGKSSFAADALRTVALSLLGVVSNRLGERLVNSALLLPPGRTRR